MPLTAIVLVGLGTLMMACHSVTQRFALRGGGVLSNRQVLLAQHGLSLLVLLASFFWWAGGATPVGDQASIFWLAIAGTTLLNVGIQYANVRSLQLADASLVKPIQALTPGLVVVAAMLLHEYPSRQGVAGILLVSVGMYIHAREDAHTLREWLLPLVFLFTPPDITARPPGERTATLEKVLALRWAFFSALLGTGALICDGLAARNGSVELGFCVQAVALTTIFALTIPRPPDPWPYPQPGRFRVWLLAGLLGLFYGLHIVLVMTALRLSPVAYIGSLKRFSIVLIGVLSWWVLRERQAKKRLVPICIITIGAMLLALDDSANRLIAILDAP